SANLIIAFTLSLLSHSVLSQYSNSDYKTISNQDSVLFKQAKKLISSGEFYIAQEAYYKSDNLLHTFPLFVKHLFTEKAFKEVCDVYEHSKKKVFNESYFTQHIISEYQESKIKYDFTHGKFHFTLLETEPKIELLSTLEKVGLSYCEIGLYNEGLDVFLEIIQLNPESDANIEILQVIEGMSRTQQIKWLEKAYRAGSESDSIIDRLAKLYQQSNDFENIYQRWEHLLLPLADNYRMVSHYIDYLLTQDSLNKAASFIHTKMPAMFFKPLDKFYLSQSKSSTLKEKYLKTKESFHNEKQNSTDNLNITDDEKQPGDEQLQEKLLTDKRPSNDKLRKKIIRKIKPGLLSSHRSYTTIKSLVNILENLIFIEGGNYINESPDIAYLDGHLKPLIDTEPNYIIDRGRKVKVNDFFLQNTEITNSHYREFINWVKDSITRRTLAKKFDGHITKNDKTGKYILNNNIEININNDSVLKFLSKQNIIRSRPNRFSNVISYNTDTLTYKGIQIYPDTTCWLNHSSFAQTGSMTRTYYWHPAYNDYPVVGVSQLQARAYCKWLTYRTNQLLRRKGTPDSISVNFRLPTKDERNHSFFTGIAGKDFFKDTLNSINNFESLPFLLACSKDWNALYTYNSGEIDYPGLRKKDYSSDESSITTKVAHYRPLPYKELYDLRGNVAEWTLNAVPPVNDLLTSISYSETKSNSKTSGVTYEELKKVFSKPQLQKMIDLFPETNQFLAYLDYLNNFPPLLPEEWVKHDYNRLGLDGKKINHSLSKYESLLISLRNHAIQYANRNAFIVKGGSWADGPEYMVHWVDEIQPAEKQSPRIGFRLAVDIIHK
ncbi:MAG: SUMF1/EgtB/PvdO family nonheme iron enzyme, partial [Bacteroidota bacterium]